MTATVGTFRRNTVPEVGGDAELRALLIDIVFDYENNRPRSLQKRIGPSSIGEPCARKLAYMISQFPEPVDHFDDSWFAILGTAMHTYLSEAVQRRNEQLGYERFWIERTVQLRHLLTGSCDLYDRELFRVIDYKLLGKDTHRKYRINGMPDDYRAQIHGYGLGYVNEGFDVRQVSLAMFPRFDFLTRGLHVITEDFDPGIATRALDRVSTVERLITILQPTTDPSQFRRFPAKPGPSCRFCPWKRPGEDTGATCPGDTK